ncbi:hypothetical protein HME9304_00377 [Flagellimonas maritima]|uniref:Uncharacterized protein n=1 Tax=Flagellimonas maritima TaxID=1383885 RepID=A0A2Z4LNS6_9FLAO|nr:hypothetical protein HME9304_00377 [Allomuricauda aurantiaca]
MKNPVESATGFFYGNLLNRIFCNAPFFLSSLSQTTKTPNTKTNHVSN